VANSQQPLVPQELFVSTHFLFKLWFDYSGPSFFAVLPRRVEFHIVTVPRRSAAATGQRLVLVRYLQIQWLPNRLCDDQAARQTFVTRMKLEIVSSSGCASMIVPGVILDVRCEYQLATTLCLLSTKSTAERPPDIGRFKRLCSTSSDITMTRRHPRPIIMDRLRSLTHFSDSYISDRISRHATN